MPQGPDIRERSKLSDALIVGVVSKLGNDNTLSAQTTLSSDGGGGQGTVRGVSICSSYGRPSLHDVVLLARLPGTDGYVALGHIN